MIFAFSPLKVVTSTVYFVKNYFFELLGFMGLGALVTLSKNIPLIGPIVSTLGCLAVFSGVVEFVIATINNRFFSWKKLAQTYLAYLFFSLGAAFVSLFFLQVGLLLFFFVDRFQHNQYIAFVGIFILAVSYAWIMIRSFFLPWIVNNEGISLYAVKKSWQITKGTIPAQIVAGMILVCFFNIMSMIALLGLYLTTIFLIGLSTNFPIFLLSNAISSIVLVFTPLYFSHMYLAIRKK